MYNAFNRWNKHLLTWFEGKLRVITHLPENRVDKCFVIPFTFNSKTILIKTTNEDFHLTNDSTLFLGRYVRKLKEF